MSDNDLIRRGEVREFLQQCGLMGNHPNDPLAVMFNEIPAVQPTVKPLVWEGEGHWFSGDNEGWLEEANTPFGWGYAVESGNLNDGPWIISNSFGETLTGFDNPEAAKAAAQADYEARILSVLDMQPTVSPDVAALVEALEYYADQYCEGFCQDLPSAGYTDEKCELDCGGCKARAALARVKGVM